MGLAVKTDGAAVASGAITDAWIRAQAFAEAGTSYGEGWILMIATTVKTFIDIFIVVWVFILAFIWCAGLDRIPGKKIRAAEIWHRFPKFVIGCAATFVILLVVSYPASIMSKASESQIGEAEAQLITLERERTAAALGGEPTAAFDVRLTAARSRIEAIESGIATSRAALATARIATDENNVFRQLFFAVTFFTIGVVSNFKSIREERIGKLAAAGLVALFGFVIWIGLLISWIFFHGIKPPIAG